MSRLSKVETYAIRWLAHKGSDVADISKELKIPETKIVSVLEKNQTINEDNNIKTGSTPTKKTSKDLMVNETSVKKTKSVSIMTEAASQNYDEARKKMHIRKSEEGIFRPNK